MMKIFKKNIFCSGSLHFYRVHAQEARRGARRPVQAADRDLQQRGGQLQAARRGLHPPGVQAQGGGQETQAGPGQDLQEAGE